MVKFQSISTRKAIVIVQWNVVNDLAKRGVELIQDFIGNVTIEEFQTKIFKTRQPFLFIYQLSKILHQFIHFIIYIYFRVSRITCLNIL